MHEQKMNDLMQKIAATKAEVKMQVTPRLVERHEEAFLGKQSSGIGYFEFINYFCTGLTSERHGEATQRRHGESCCLSTISMYKHALTDGLES